MRKRTEDTTTNQGKVEEHGKYRISMSFIRNLHKIYTISNYTSEIDLTYDKIKRALRDISTGGGLKPSTAVVTTGFFLHLS